MRNLGFLLPLGDLSNVIAGNPKGAVLLHETLAAASVANQHGGGPLDLTSVSISYMPVRPSSPRWNAR